MGKIRQSPLGTISGAFGNLIGSSWKGIPYIKVRPSSYTDAKSKGQIKCRSRLSGCSKLAKTLKFTIVRPLWDNKAIAMTGHNRFISKNSKAFDEFGNIESYDNLVFTFGDLPLPSDIAVHANTEVPGEINLTWTDNSGYHEAIRSDRLNLITIINGEAEHLYNLEETRSSQSAVITLPAAVNNRVHLYLFFKNEENNYFSSSYYQMVQC
jgi:hypothetical protein